MPLLGAAALAMWWEMAPDVRPEFEEWHSREHFPERLGLPGFRRGSRWRGADGGEGFFVLYELDDYATLTSPGYMARLNDPTPWSRRMMPHHRNMVRSQCRVLQSIGGGIGGTMVTVRLSPAAGREESLRGFLRGAFADFVQRRGIAAAHLLRTETPAAPATTEQKIRGNDAAADWIALLSGYDLDALSEAAGAGLAGMAAAGAASHSEPGSYRLSHAVTSEDR